MTISAVTICNMALSNIGTRSNIESLDEASAEAAQCKLWYDYARKQSLEAFDWNFARKRITLALDSEDADGIDWAYRYQYPADCLRARRIINPNGYTDDAVPFDVEISTDGQRKTIVTNLQDASLIYTFNQTREDFFEPLFVKALSHLLGSYVAYPLTTKEQVMSTQYQLYQQMLGFASMTNANEQVSETPRLPDWMRNR